MKEFLGQSLPQGVLQLKGIIHFHTIMQERLILAYLSEQTIGKLCYERFRPGELPETSGL